MERNKRMRFKFVCSTYEEGSPETADHQVISEFDVSENQTHDLIRSRFFEFLNGCGYVIRSFEDLGKE